MAKAQAALPLIVAIIIILIIALTFSSSFKTVSSQDTSHPVFGFVLACLQESGAKAIDEVGKSGGYSSKTPLSGLPSPILPQVEIERSLGLQTVKLLPDCYDGFKVLQSQGWFVEDGPAKVTVSILPGKVLFELDQKILVKKDNSVIIKSDFSAQVETPLDEVLSAARKLQEPHPEGHDITPLIDGNINATFFVAPTTTG